MTLIMTSAQAVETSVNVTNNSPSRDYSHPDDQTTQTIIIQLTTAYPLGGSLSVVVQIELLASIK